MKGTRLALVTALRTALFATPAAAGSSRAAESRPIAASRLSTVRGATVLWAAALRAFDWPCRLAHLVGHGDGLLARADLELAQDVLDV
jgi:hypothetical protein